MLPLHIGTTLRVYIRMFGPAVSGGLAVKRYFANTVHVVAISLFAATSGLAQQPVFGIRVVDEKVFADLPVATLSQHLAQLTQAAGIQLTLSHNLTLENELYANGASLYRVVDNLLPESYGFAFELDQSFMKRII